MCKVELAQLRKEETPENSKNGRGKERVLNSGTYYVGKLVSNPFVII